MPLRQRLPSRTELRARLARGARAALPGALAALAVAAAAAGATFGYHWLTTSPRFALETVEVHGTHSMPAGQVRRALSPAIGENLFRLPLPAIERRLRAEPWIADAQVRRRLPDELVVDVTERAPAARVELGGLYLARANGTVFKRADTARGEGQGLPVITGITRRLYLHHPARAHTRIRAALAAARVYREAPQRPPLGEIHSDSRGAVTLYTRAPVMALVLGAPATDAVLRRRLRAFDAAWAALSPSERAVAGTLYLDRDASPVRVTVAFAAPPAAPTQPPALTP